MRGTAVDSRKIRPRERTGLMLVASAILALSLSSIERMPAATGRDADTIEIIGLHRFPPSWSGTAVVGEALARSGYRGAPEVPTGRVRRWERPAGRRGPENFENPSFWLA
jgi:hypothetical protein